MAEPPRASYRARRPASCLVERIWNCTPLVVSNGTVKIRILGRILQGSDGAYRVPITIGVGASARTHQVEIDSSVCGLAAADPTRPFKESLLPAEGPWIFRGFLVIVDDAEGFPLEEILLRIKHAVLRHDKMFDRMRREVEAFENIERSETARRERIPDSVRLFVWQRDEGKCVRCGSSEKLEFDHIIPVAKGGSNTERNIQLLCEQR